MSSKQQRRRRRQAEKSMEEAWEAVLADKLHIASRASVKARDLGDVNPRILQEHGQIMMLCGDEDEALAALRRAIGLAPDYAEARIQLARVHAELGNWVQAARQQRWAMELVPDDVMGERVFAEYMEHVEDPGLVYAEEDDPVESADECTFTERTERLPWERIREEVLRCGGAVLPGLLSTTECEELRALYADWHNFEHEVVNDAPDDGIVTYRFFSRPLPRLVEALRREVYGRAARMVNGLHEMVGIEERFPLAHEEFLECCREAGQTRTTPILLHYPVGGFNALHQDVSGRVVFPLQLAVTLGPGCSVDGGGGEFRLADLRPGKKVRRTQFATDVGDGVLFCTRNRLARVAGTYGLQPVAHGVSEVVGRERYALGVPFHEHG